LSGKRHRSFGKAIDFSRIRPHRIAPIAGVTVAATAGAVIGTITGILERRCPYQSPVECQPRCARGGIHVRVEPGRPVIVRDYGYLEQ